MDQWKIYELSGDAEAFFRKELGKAGPLAMTINPDCGKIWGFLPRNDAALSNLSALEEGVFTPDEAWQMQEKIVRFIKEYLDAESLNILLCEDRYFSLNDPPIAMELNLFEFAETTYHYLTSPCTAKEIENVMTLASFYPAILLLSKRNSARLLPQRHSIGKDFSDELSRNVRHLMLGAFDEEGYLIWSCYPQYD